MKEAVDRMATKSEGDVASRSGTPRAQAARVPRAELAVVALLVLTVVPALIVTARTQVSEQQAIVTLSVTSDPQDAAVIVDDLLVGRTPVELQLRRGDEVALRVEAREPFLEYDLYKPFRTSLTVDSDRNLDVWIPRTTADEQAAQQAARLNTTTGSLR